MNSGSLSINKRTSGDGMEYNTASARNNKLLVKAQEKLGFPAQGKFLISRSILNSFRPISPDSKPIYLTPKYVPSHKKKSLFNVKQKEPKFVPYEPYKAAVFPIMRKKWEENNFKAAQQMKKVNSKNNVDIKDLVTQMSEMVKVEFSKSEKDAMKSEEVFVSKKKWEEDKLAYETDLKNLRETNAHLENQVKFQAQVNSELKTLLVAAVGEDLESRVQHLTEDKLQLARALLNSANHLTSHQEQTEWLSGQCEVWRSKFLASSLMVEELLGWKSMLGEKSSNLEAITKQLLEERGSVRDFSFRTFCALSSMAEHLAISRKPVVDPLNSCDIITLTERNYRLTELVENKLLKNIPEPKKHQESDILHLPVHTHGELAALKALQKPVSLIERPESVCNAVVGAAAGIAGGQMYLQHPSDHAKCCEHCRDDPGNE